MRIRRAWLLSLCVFLCMLAPAALAEGLNRALLVGCDRFVTQQHTTPSSANNVTRMADALSGGAMNLERLVTRRNNVTSAEQLAELVQLTFGDAGEEDVSYFYISTHGLWQQGQANAAMTLLLSDGFTASQADYGIANCGDWNAYALAYARQYYGSLETSEIEAMLIADGFTAAQAAYAAEQIAK